MERILECMDTYSFNGPNVTMPQSLIDSLNANPFCQGRLDGFIQDEGCNYENKSFAIEAARACLNGDEVDYEEKIILDSTFVNNQKVKCIYDKLVRSAVSNHNLIRETFIGFGDGNFNESGLIYKLEPNLVNSNGDVINGKTQRRGNLYIITLNYDRIDFRSPIEIAKTIIHESIHALLKKHYNTATNSFVELYGEYMGQYTGSNDVTHAIMRDNYIALMANNLKEFDNDQELQSFYEDISWEGLHAFLSQDDIDQILGSMNYARMRGLNCE